MSLNTVERERITDNLLKIQSVKESLDQLDDRKIPNADAIQDCLESADHSLREALGYSSAEEAETSQPSRRNDELK